MSAYPTTSSFLLSLCACNHKPVQLFYQAVTECQPLCVRAERRQRKHLCPPVLLTVMTYVSWLLPHFSICAKNTNYHDNFPKNKEACCLNLAWNGKIWFSTEDFYIFIHSFFFIFVTNLTEKNIPSAIIMKHELVLLRFSVKENKQFFFFF